MNRRVSAQEATIQVEAKVTFSCFHFIVFPDSVFVSSSFTIDYELGEDVISRILIQLGF